MATGYLRSVDKYCFASVIFILIFVITNGQVSDFNPHVTGVCIKGVMYINVITDEPFYGVVHTRDYRDNSVCRIEANGARNTTLAISALANQQDDNYCGVHKHKDSQEDRSVAIAVRVHKDLELSQDKYFSITCSQSSFLNSFNARSYLSLKILPYSSTSPALLHGSSYTLVLNMTNPDGVTLPFVKDCIAYTNKNDSHVNLLTDGCPGLIESFKYEKYWATSKIPEMFKFPDSNRVYIQCTVIPCTNCNREIDCSRKNSALRIPTGPYLLASTSAYVVEPGENFAEYVKASECSKYDFPWLLPLAIVLGILLLIMMIINIFLCTSLSCTCTKTEVVEKEEGSELEDYDPYKIDWSANNNYAHSNYTSRSELAKDDVHDYRPTSRYSHRSTPSINRPYYK